MPQNSDGEDRSGRDEAFDSLSREIAPPPELEDRIVAALCEEQLIGAGGASFRRLLPLRAALAASLLLVALLGFASGRMSAPVAGAEGGDYLLLLQPGPTQTFPLGRAEEARRGREYSAWFREALGRGEMVGGEKLIDRASAVLEGRPGGGPPRRLQRGGSTVEGYFIIRAGDDAEAERIAAGCPHLRYGGVIEIRRIDRLEETGS